MKSEVFADDSKVEASSGRRHAADWSKVEMHGMQRWSAWSMYLLGRDQLISIEEDAGLNVQSGLCIQ